MKIEELAEHADEAAQLLKALSNQSRLMVLCILSEGELSVAELLEQVPLSQSALSQHLARLRAEELVKTRKEAQTVYYSLKDKNAARIISLLHDIYCSPS